MEPHTKKDHVDEFVFELLRTGLMLCDLVSDLIEALPADAYPGEDPGTVVIEMLCGTVRTGFKSVDPREIRRATRLIDQAGRRTIEHLRVACELSRRIHGDEIGPGKTYG